MTHGSQPIVWANVADERWNVTSQRYSRDPNHHRHHAIPLTTAQRQVDSLVGQNVADE